MGSAYLSHGLAEHSRGPGVEVMAAGQGGFGRPSLTLAASFSAVQRATAGAGASKDLPANSVAVTTSQPLHPAGARRLMFAARLLTHKRRPSHCEVLSRMYFYRKSCPSSVRKPGANGKTRTGTFRLESLPKALQPHSVRRLLIERKLPRSKVPSKAKLLSERITLSLRRSSTN